MPSVLTLRHGMVTAWGGGHQRQRCGMFAAIVSLHWTQAENDLREVIRIGSVSRRRAGQIGLVVSYVYGERHVEDGLAYALLTHESQLIFVAIIGAISFFIIFRKEKLPVAPLVQTPKTS